MCVFKYHAFIYFLRPPPWYGTPRTICSVCFGCFDTSPKHWNKPKNFWGVSRKKQTKKQLKQFEFRFEPWQKINCFEDPLMENVFWRFFRVVSKKFCLFRLFWYWSETPKQTETNRKKCFLVSRNKPKNNRNRLSFGLFRFEPKKIWLFRGHSNHNWSVPGEGAFQNDLSISGWTEHFRTTFAFQDDLSISWHLKQFEVTEAFQDNLGILGRIGFFRTTWAFQDDRIISGQRNSSISRWTWIFQDEFNILE
jgi:hypothetical protein